MIKIYLTGLFPRSRTIRRALRDFDKKIINHDSLKKVYEEEVVNLVSLQAKNNFDFIYDGMLNWQDFLRPFCNAKGVSAGPLIRWFETNFFYRVPLILSKIEYTKPILKDFYFLDLIKEKSSICLLDPLSFLALSDISYYKNFDECFFDFSDILVKEVYNILKNNKIDAIHIVSPIIGFQKLSHDEFLKINQFIEEIRKIANVALISLNIYYFKAYENSKYLSEIKADLLGVDLCYGDREKIIKSLKGISTKISLGLIDSFISYVEDPEYIIKEINRISKELNLEEIYLTNSSELDRLPYEIAIEKVNLMGKIKRDYKDG